MKTFAENIKSIPSSTKTVLIRLFDDKGNLLSVIPNIPGSQGSVQVFQHIADKNGRINFEAAKEGLRLFGEHVDDAMKNPGKHQKLELLFGLQKSESCRIEFE